MEAIKEFGVEPKLLVAQIINFVILLLVLTKLAYKPILKMLEERKARIAESMQQAKQIEERMRKLEHEQAELLHKARTEADKVITESKESAKEIATTSAQQAKEQAEKVLLRAQENAKVEFGRMRQELRKELVGVAVVAAQKATEEILTTEQKEKITRKAAQEIVS